MSFATLQIDEGACRSCKRKILWIVNENGKKEPFDARPSRALVRDGAKGYNFSGNALERRGYSMTTASTFVFSAHLPHFVTCPKADKHRGSK